ncbi:hypothetical protein Cch01nite_04780 [Cellulomonas chitinilytica]|uniref:Peptidase M11 gametolysin domain-containing protein n=1 Tax=Cellulomonas chitinilytica TaxID=398759 RepID=A0A919P275_9CELL|nr:hypothetical protein Cch01nite_04780 [Cellulomonas chitinilytica]
MRARVAAVAVSAALALVGAVAGAGTAAADAPSTGTEHITGTYERLQVDPPVVAPAAAATPPTPVAPTDADHDLVRLADGTSVQVEGTPDLFEDVAPGQKVTVTGTATADEPAVPEATSTFEGTAVRELTAAPDAAAVTSRTVAVVLLQLGPAGPAPWSVDDARRNFFTGDDSVAAFFRESSFSQLELRGRDRADGDVYGSLQIPADTACGNEAQAGQDALQAAGLDLSAYDHVAYVLDSADRGCWFGGWAYVGGQVSVNLYAGDWGTRSVANHELGHNLGLSHAQSLYCTGPDGQATSVEVTGGTCSVWEYGDPFDTMGNNWIGFQYSASYKARLGWVAPSGITTVSASGTYTLAPSEVTTDQPQVLRIPLPSGESYDLDVRQPFGQFWDAQVKDYPALLDGVEVRRANEWTTQLVDTTPDGSFSDAALQVGRTFTDPAAGVSIRTESVGPEGAVVHVDLGVVEQEPVLYGTFNSGAPGPMTKVPGTASTWTADETFSGPWGRFRVTVDPSGTTYGDLQPDGVLDQGAPDIVVPDAGTYTITVDLATLAYSVVSTTGGGGGFASSYPTMTLRGTSTEWTVAPMELVADHTWRHTMAFGAHPVEEFLFDVDGTGAVTFGDTGVGDGTAEPGGPNIPLTQGPAIYEVTFHDDTLTYSVSRVW